MSNTSKRECCEKCFGFKFGGSGRTCLNEACDCHLFYDHIRREAFSEMNAKLQEHRLIIACRPIYTEDGANSKEAELSGWDKAAAVINSLQLPQEKKDILREKEIVICAAIRFADDSIIRGHRHNDCFHTADGKGLSKVGNIQGFITSKNRFVERKEAYELQKAAGIKSVLPKEEAYFHGELYSEDLY